MFVAILFGWHGPKGYGQPNGGETDCQRMMELGRSGKYAEAILPGEQCASAIRSLGEENLKYATAISTLAELYGRVGRYKDAEALANRAREITEKILTPGHVDAAASLDLLGRLYLTQGHYAKAEPFISRGRELREKASIESRQGLAESLNNLAALYREQGRFDEAAPLFERARGIIEQSILEKKVTRDDALHATVLNSLGFVYLKQGRLRQAESLLKQSLAIRERTLAEDHPVMAFVINNLGVLYETQGRWKDAETSYRRALSIREKSLGPNHPYVAITLSDLGGLYKSQMRYIEAENLLRRALKIRTEKFGNAHPHVGSVLLQLSDLYGRQGDCKKANGLFEDAQQMSDAPLEQVVVFFGTDRQQISERASVEFGDALAYKNLTFGLGIAAVPSAKPASGPTSNGVAQIGSEATTEGRRIALLCTQVVSHKDIVDEALRKLGASKRFPNQAFVFVHGYNVPFDSAVRRAAQIAYDLKFDGGTFLFSWPSVGSLFAYGRDVDNAELAAVDLMNFLNMIVAKTNVTKIHLVAHSMGALSLLGALEKIAAAPPGLKIGEIILAAPDIGQKKFEAKIEEIGKLDLKTTLYASANDKALILSAWYRDFRCIWARDCQAQAGAISKDGPFIVRGVETIDITDIDDAGTGIFNAHDIYAWSPTIVRDMRLLFEKSERPPDARTEGFRQITAKQGVYWKYLPKVIGEVVQL